MIRKIVFPLSLILSLFFCMSVWGAEKGDPWEELQAGDRLTQEQFIELMQAGCLEVSRETETTIIYNAVYPDGEVPRTPDTGGECHLVVIYFMDGSGHWVGCVPGYTPGQIPCKPCDNSPVMG